MMDVHNDCWVNKQLESGVNGTVKVVEGRGVGGRGVKERV